MPEFQKDQCEDLFGEMATSLVLCHKLLNLSSFKVSSLRSYRAYGKSVFFLYRIFLGIRPPNAFLGCILWLILAPSSYSAETPRILVSYGQSLEASFEVGFEFDSKFPIVAPQSATSVVRRRRGSILPKAAIRAVQRMNPRYSRANLSMIRAVRSVEPPTTITIPKA